jgi:hypothetical protein
MPTRGASSFLEQWTIIFAMAAIVTSFQDSLPHYWISLDQMVTLRIMCSLKHEVLTLFPLCSFLITSQIILASALAIVVGGCRVLLWSGLNLVQPNKVQFIVWAYQTSWFLCEQEPKI